MSDDNFYFGYALFMTFALAIACLSMTTVLVVCRPEQRRLSSGVQVLV